MVAVADVCVVGVVVGSVVGTADAGVVCVGWGVVVAVVFVVDIDAAGVGVVGIGCGVGAVGGVIVVGGGGVVVVGVRCDVGGVCCDVGAVGCNGCCGVVRDVDVWVWLRCCWCCR